MGVKPVPCALPEQDDPDDVPREWHEDVGWKVSETCTHDYCLEANGYLWMAGAVRRERMTSDERAALEGDAELMLDEFHGRGLSG